MINIILALIIAIVFVVSFTILILPGMIKASNTKNMLLNIDSTKSQQSDHKKESFRDRVITPTVKKLTVRMGSLFPIGEKEQELLKDDLRRAGISISAKEYFSQTILSIIAFGLLGAFLGFILAFTSSAAIIGLLFGAAIAYILRRFSLKSQITKRKDKMFKQLPNVLDILSIGITAGLGFDQAIKYVIEKDTGPLIDEFDMARKEILLGKSRKEALANLAYRCDVPEIKTFVGAINQSEELGISLKNVLNTQSKSVRKLFQQRIEENSMKVPVKILFPIVMFIFPVIFLVILGPAVPVIMKTFSEM